MELRTMLAIAFGDRSERPCTPRTSQLVHPSSLFDENGCGLSLDIGLDSVYRAGKFYGSIQGKTIG